MSVLLEKAKKLMSETGCTLSEAAKALKDASEDYDLAMELVKENGHFDAKEPAKEVAPILASEEPASETAEELVPETIEEPTSEVNEEPIPESVEESTEEYAQELTPEYEQDPNAYYEQDPNAYYEEDPYAYYEQDPNAYYEDSQDSVPAEEPQETYDEAQKELVSTETEDEPEAKPAPKFEMPKAFITARIVLGIIGSVFMIAIGLCVLVFAYFGLGFSFDDIFKKGPVVFLSPLSVALAGIVVVLIGFINLLFTKKKANKPFKYLPKLQQVKNEFPDLADEIIYFAFFKGGKNVDKTISFINKNRDRFNDAGVLSEVEKQKSLQNIKSFYAVMLFGILSAALWVIAVVTYNPELNKDFDVVQIGCALGSLVFLIIELVVAFSGRKKGANRIVFVYVFSFFILGLLIPLLIDLEKYTTFLGQLFVYILATFVILVIISIVLEKIKNVSNAPRKKRWFDKDEEKSDKKRYGLIGTDGYDEHGNRTGTIDENGNIYDEHWNNKGRIDENGNIYDEHWNKKGSIDKDGNIYDEHWNKKGSIDKDGRMYDEHGNSIGRRSDR